MPCSPAQDQRDFSWKYPAAFLTSALVLLLLFSLGLARLDRAGLLPPPQLTNNLCDDLKLQFLRTHRFEPPSVLAVGSSVTLMNFNADAVRQATDGRAMTYNAAFCGLKINQTAYAAKYFVNRVPSVRDVLTIVAPEDLTECWLNNPHIFTPAAVDDYVYRHRWAFPLYVAYFDPIVLAKNVMILHEAQEGRGEWVDLLGMDRYGDVPILEKAAAPTLVYSALPPLDPACFAALHDLARDIMAGGRRLVVVTTPLHPDWLERYDPDGKLIEEIPERIRAAIAGTNATFWDAEREYRPPRADFYDAIHIRAPAVPAFSRALAGATGLGRPASMIGLDHSNSEPDVRRSSSSTLHLGQPTTGLGEDVQPTP